MSSYEKITLEERGHIAIITINRPERMNAIDPQTSKELHEAWSHFRDTDDLWVGVITGAGDRAFSAGNDLVAMSQAQQTGDTAAMAHGGAAFGGITRGFECWKPIIAAINGYCLAGGLEIALSCDIRVASENASFGLPEPTRGIIPGAGGTQRLPRMVPMAVAMKLLMTGGRIDARAALAAGLVSDVVPQDQLLSKAREIAEEICSCGPLAVRAIKEAAIRGREMSLDEGLALESEKSREIGRTEDAREGPLAFAQKRKPEYKGR
jgi:enoyl-CoA hydratase/carnithine racemase